MAFDYYFETGLCLGMAWILILIGAIIIWAAAGGMWPALFLMPPLLFLVPVVVWLWRERPSLKS